jgi:hypothetical protein
MIEARHHAADDLLRGQFKADDRIGIVDSDGTWRNTVRFDETIGLYS